MRRCAARWCRRGSMRWPRGVLVEGELGLAGPLALLQGAARGLDVPELGAPGRLLAVVGLLGSSVPAGLVLGGAGFAWEPCAFGPWRLLGEEAAGTPSELRCPRGVECGAAV